MKTLLLLASMSMASMAVAQTTWPDKPITMIVPFPPGGVAEPVARPVAEALSRELKQPVVVENRVGAGGALGMGMGMAARAAADGYTLLLSLSSISILPEAAWQLGQLRHHACADGDAQGQRRVSHDAYPLYRRRAGRCSGPWAILRRIVGGGVCSSGRNAEARRRRGERRGRFGK